MNTSGNNTNLHILKTGNKTEYRLNKCFKKNSDSISNPLEALWYLKHFFLICFI